MDFSPIGFGEDDFAVGAICNMGEDDGNLPEGAALLKGTPPDGCAASYGDADHVLVGRLRGQGSRCPHSESIGRFPLSGHRFTRAGGVDCEKSADAGRRPRMT